MQGLKLEGPVIALPRSPGTQIRRTFGIGMAGRVSFVLSALFVQFASSCPSLQSEKVALRCREFGEGTMLGRIPMLSFDWAP
jgi:hypothetical protein